MKRAAIVVAALAIWTLVIEWLAGSFGSRAIGTIATLIETGRRIDRSEATGVADFSVFFTWLLVAGLATVLMVALVSWVTGGRALSSIRSLFTAPVIVVLVVWSAFMFLYSMFNGSGVGGPRCFTVPNPCAPDGGFPQQVVWVVGCLVVLGMAYARRRRTPAE